MKSFAPAPSLALLPLLLPPAHSKPFVPCRSDKPGHEDHRTLYIPPDYFSDYNAEDDGSEDRSEAKEERRLARALCCVHTRVVVHPGCREPWMEKYKGWQDVDGSSATEVMENAMKDVCQTKMGREECPERRGCVEDAMAGRVADAGPRDRAAAAGSGAVARTTTTTAFAVAMGIWMGGRWW